MSVPRESIGIILVGNGVSRQVFEADFETNIDPIAMYRMHWRSQDVSQKSQPASQPTHSGYSVDIY